MPPGGSWVSVSSPRGPDHGRNSVTHGKNHLGVGMSVKVVVRKRPVPEGGWDVLDVALRVLLIWYIGDHYFLNYGLNVEWNIK